MAKVQETKADFFARLAAPGPNARVQEMPASVQETKASIPQQRQTPPSKVRVQQTTAKVQETKAKQQPQPAPAKVAAQQASATVQETKAEFFARLATPVEARVQEATAKVQETKASPRSTVAPAKSSVQGTLAKAREPRPRSSIRSDSSDGGSPAPMKLSALTKALLHDQHPSRMTYIDPKPLLARYAPAVSTPTKGTASEHPSKMSYIDPMPILARHSGLPEPTDQHPSQMSYIPPLNRFYDHLAEVRQERARDDDTPKTGVRTVRIPVASSGSAHTSARAKSLAKTPGAFLSGPARRLGRQSEEHNSPDPAILSPVALNAAGRATPPPPPKMTVLDTATSAAGASTATQPNKKRQFLFKINGRSYTKIDCIGRGASGKVYRVSAESGKMFALKRMPLDKANPGALQGYKVEIDLLQRLAEVERVAQLYDHELNVEKNTLSLLMEIGELDFHTFLKDRRDADDNYQFDPVFVRHWWKELLECVQAVHAKDVVHSDLKPLNFVLVRGRLKLIDFGIANAIDPDMTVNVHRERQIGTPNYMSPESLMDANHYAISSANHGEYVAPRGIPFTKGATKLMKLGKPSDVWSLGCILYQMVYGQPPFANVSNTITRCYAIMDWEHAIDFPEYTIHGVRVPPSLIRTMRRCLNRDQTLRPTCEELLQNTDPFLYPVEQQGDAIPLTQDMLSRVIQNVVQQCRKELPSDHEVLSIWPQAYWSGVQKMLK